MLCLIKRVFNARYGLKQGRVLSPVIQSVYKNLLQDIKPHNAGIDI